MAKEKTFDLRTRKLGAFSNPLGCNTNNSLGLGLWTLGSTLFLVLDISRPIHY